MSCEGRRSEGCWWLRLRVAPQQLMHQSEVVGLCFISHLVRSVWDWATGESESVEVQLQRLT